MNCLICYKPLESREIDYHPKCVAKIFGTNQVPEFDIDESQLSQYAKQIVGTHQAITGVQPKLSLWLEATKSKIRFTIRDNKSNFIVKPQSEVYKSLPENEDLCMHMAAEVGIRVANHSLIRLSSGNLAYITKRFDREGTHKIACEDLCQLSETLTEHKYRGSYEKTGKTIRQYSTHSGLDVLDYFKLVMFSFITGNADMHLKNFSMLEKPDGTFGLSPAYDQVCTHLVIPNESEQMSLNLNGKKNKLNKADFDALGKNLELHEKQILNCYQSFTNKSGELADWISRSFLPETQKDILTHLVLTRINLFEK